jgi:signal peptidase I
MLISCPDCRRQISDEAVACPHCGKTATSEQRAAAIAAANLRPAGFFLRLAARLADYGVISLLILLVVVVAALMESYGLVGGWIWALVPLSLAPIFLLYFTLPTARSGQTWGKKLAGIRVENSREGLLPAGFVLLRTSLDLVFVILQNYLLGLIDPLLVSFTRDKRAIHDFAAGSFVQVRSRRHPALIGLAIFGFLAPGLLLFLVIRPFLVQAFFIPSSSMEPTLHMPQRDESGSLRRSGDRFLVNKLIFHLSSPRRGDVVVYKAPPQACLPNSGITGAGELFVKRVVGLPGDRVSVRRGEGVFINGNRLEEPYLMETARGAKALGIAFPNYSWPVDIYSNSLPAFQVPAGQVFVLGDNRNNSNDSHLWRDPDTGRPEPGLPLQNLCGKASMIFWPRDRFGREVR